MLRFRRYRVFAALSLFIIFLLYRSSTPSSNFNLDFVDGTAGQLANKVPDWHTNPDKINQNLDKNLNIPSSQKSEPEGDENSQKEEKLTDTENKEFRSNDKFLELETSLETPGTFRLPSETIAPHVEVGEETAAAVNVEPVETDPPTIPVVRPGGIHHNDVYQVHPSSTIHWTPVPENFPVQIDELIALPTASPESIPRIQFRFGKEDARAKAVRESRMERVKAEMKHAWSGYQKYAWLHDEIMPVSLLPKDPFCGWAATLVDSLDTLWIMGMVDEFDNAVKAVAEIDFTYSAFKRTIPVFETTIRYLGGLLGAYDVSGGVATNKEYGVLLDKAEELAEILMGIFDTPNRMPILYFDYTPQSVAQPKRASTDSGVAELGSLLMEFTRLAQVSGKHKYYDAVARITNGLDDLAKLGTTYPGLFPQNLDTSGCYRTRPSTASSDIRHPDSIVQGFAPNLSPNSKSEENTVLEPKFNAELGSNSNKEVDDSTTRGFANSEDTPVASGLAETEESSLVKRELYNPPHLPEDISANCQPQGIVPAGFSMESYSIGGSQDSTYEYFPKEWLLLGAKEPQYKRLAIDALEATKNSLLFRPMIKDEDREILFSAKIIHHKDSKPTYEFEVTHLSCFVGGMFGMAGKIFERDEYIDIAEKLTDGCVWAYEMMPTGIMPEYGTLVPCQNTHSCTWNETAWHQWIDPMWKTRDKQVEDYDEKRRVKLEEAARESSQVAEQEKEQAALKQSQHWANVVKAEAARQAELLHGGTDAHKNDHTPITDEEIDQTMEKMIGGSALENPGEASQAEPANLGESATVHSMIMPTDEKSKGEAEVVRESTLRKRDMEASSEELVRGSIANSGTRSVNKEVDKDYDSTPAPESREEAEKLISSSPADNKETSLETDMQSHQAYDPLTDPVRPLTHEAFVARRIELDRLPEGFVSIGSRSYILRPEAIESVWYMYRITGDKIWQEKGWKMFEAIITATKAEGGHSAINDVTMDPPQQNDSMESFWLAETLKYFYLLFADPDLISLDDWVLNTEAHPFKRPKPISTRRTK